MLFRSDRQSQLTVQLLHEGMELPAGNCDPLLPDASLCWIGGELIRIGRAQFLGNNQYLLTMLQRGCHGTESAIGAHGPSEAFVFLERDSIIGVDSAFARLGAGLTIEALGVSDSVPTVASVQVQGLAIHPFAPVHAAAERLADGGLRLSWVRRTRIDSGWQDFVDVPMAEGNLQYEIVILRNGTVVASVNADSAEMFIMPMNLTAWGAISGDQLTFQIAQIGQYSRSQALILHYAVPT